MKDCMIKLDDCLELITYGFTNPMVDSDDGPWKVTAKDVVDGKINFNTARHTTQEAYDNELTDKSRPISGDILLTKDGTLGRLAIVKDEVICINQSVALLRVDKTMVCPEYVFYVLSSPEYQAKMVADAGGSTIKHIYITRVNQLLIPYISMDKQIKFVSMIKLYDDLIENNQKQIKLLEEAVQRHYKEWFVDLRFPGHEEVEIVGGSPVGWSICDLRDVIKINDENISKKYIYDYVDYVDLGSVSNGHTETITRYSLKDAPGRAKRVAKDGDMAWGMVRPNLKSYTYIFNPSETTIYSTGFAILHPVKIPFSYLFCYASTDEFVGYLVNCTNGAAYPAVKAEHFENAKILIPTDEILKQFHLVLEPMFRKIENLYSQNAKLVEIRDRLLPKLMNGEIVV